MGIIKGIGASFRPGNSLSVGARLANHMRSAILRGEIVAGTRLTQEELAEAFGVSRMPIREALQRLEAQGLIEVIPRRGMVVTEVSLRDALDIYTIRLALEPEALRSSIPNLTEEDLVTARAEIISVGESSTLLQLGKSNYKFHGTLYSRCTRPRLLNIVYTHLHAFDKYVRLQVGVGGLERLAQTEHLSLMKAVEDKDVDLGIRILREHIDKAKRQVCALFSRGKV